VDKLHQVSTFRRHFYLSDNNRVTRIYEQIETGRLVEIVCASLDTHFKGKWITIVRYDTHHGYMHKHERVSIENESTTVTILGVRQKGTRRRLLRWAIRDINTNYLVYKRKFLKRSGYSKNEIWFNLF